MNPTPPQAPTPPTDQAEVIRRLVLHYNAKIEDLRLAHATEMAKREVLLDEYCAELELLTKVVHQLTK